MREKDKQYYEIDGYKLDRVTSWIGEFEREFNSMGAAIGKYKSGVKNDRENLLSVNQQLHYWNLNSERSRCYGTGTHCFAEMYHMDSNTQPVNGEEEAVVKFITFMKEGYNYIGSELRVFNKAMRLGGTIDELWQRKKDGKYIIIDYKTTKDIDKSYSKFAKEPFKKYHQSARNRYEIQLLTYKWLGHIVLPNNKVLLTNKEDFGTLGIVLLFNTGEYKIEKVCNVTEEDVCKALYERVDYEQLIT